MRVRLSKIGFIVYRFGRAPYGADVLFDHNNEPALPVNAPQSRAMPMQFVLDNWYLFLALIVVLALLVGPNVMQYMHGIKSLSPGESVLLVNRQSGVFVDVSEPREYQAGHIPNALNVPLSNLNQGSGGLDKYKERPLIVVSRAGSQRALRAAVALRRRGFTAVHLLAGGLPAWEKENLPLEK